MMLTTCLDCGEPATNPQCDDCRPPQHDPPGRAGSTRRGYNSVWRRLSERARRLQPFCTDCGTTDDLTVDHSPEAWHRKAQGLSIRLADVEVVCRPCNAKRGAAKPTEPRGDTPGQRPNDPRGEANFQNVIPNSEIIGLGDGL